MDPSSKRCKPGGRTRIEPCCDKETPNGEPHPVPASGCRCFCVVCKVEPCARGKFCEACFVSSAPVNTALVIDTVFDSDGNPAARILGRDTNAALNLGCILFANLLGIPDKKRGMWSHHAYDRACIGARKRMPGRYYIPYVRGPAPSWDAIFAGCGLEPPFYLHTIKAATRRPAVHMQ